MLRPSEDIVYLWFYCRPSKNPAEQGWPPTCLFWIAKINLPQLANVRHRCLIRADVEQYEPRSHAFPATVTVTHVPTNSHTQVGHKKNASQVDALHCG